jgi:hypothetical protein
MSEKYTTYRILAKLGVGYIRAYVGALRTQDWGQNPSEAAISRAKAHLDASSDTSAAWLRTCTERLEALPSSSGMLPRRGRKRKRPPCMQSLWFPRDTSDSVITVILVEYVEL